jgi:signal transduction histidine kinase
LSLRLRLLLASMTTLAVGLGALLVAGNVVLDARVHSERSSLLRERTQAQISALRVRPGGIRVRETANDAVLDRQSWVLSGARVVERPAGAPPVLDVAAVALGRSRRAREADGPGDVRLRAEPVYAPGVTRPVGAVVAALSTEPLEHLQQEVLLGSLVVAGLVLLAGGLAVRNALNGALRPVALMTSSAEGWSEHDLDRRFDLGPPRDELTGLAGTLDGLLARIAASRRHEQRFASEVAHELRTPLAGLRGRAELALGASGPEADDERRAALRAVIDDVSRVDTAVDALLAIARRDLESGTGSVDLAALAGELEGVNVSAPADLPPAEGEPELVRRAIAPLVENARRHARSRVSIELSSAAGRVRFAVLDDGPGLDPELGERAFDPGVRGPDQPEGGVGLGLSLARRLARSCGGDVVAEPRAGGCFVLELPSVGTSM